MHRPAELADVEQLIEDLREVLDEPADVVRERLRRLVPEYGHEVTKPLPPAEVRG
jgi:hypothetical protein